MKEMPQLGNIIFVENIPYYPLAHARTSNRLHFLIGLWVMRILSALFFLMIPLVLVNADPIWDAGFIVFFICVVATPILALIRIEISVLDLRGITPITMFESGMFVLRTRTGSMRSRKNFIPYEQISSAEIKRYFARQASTWPQGTYMYYSAPTYLVLHITDGRTYQSGSKYPLEVMRIAAMLRYKGIEVTDAGSGLGPCDFSKWGI